MLAMKVAAMALLVGASLSAQVPVSFTMTVTVDSGNGHTMVSTERVQAANGMTRVEVVAGDSGMRAATAGSYMLMSNASDTIVTVLPRAQMMVARPASAPLFPPGLVTMRRGGAASLDVADLGDGPEIDGLPTHHYRMTADGDVIITVDSTSCTKHFHSVTDLWNTTSVELPDLLTKRFVAGLMQAVGQEQATEASALAAKRAPGVALRTESVKGGVTARMEVSDIRHDPIPASVFAHPAGYTMMDPKRMADAMNSPAMRANVAAAVRARVCTP